MFEHILMRDDILVIVVAVVLYLADVARLLYVNEVLLIRGAASRWSAITPAEGLRFARRRLVLPRVLDPGCVVLLFQWPVGGVDDALKNVAVSDLEKRLRVLWLPKYLCRILLPGIFAGLPIAYYSSDNALPLLGLLVLVYGQIIALVIWLFLSRRELAIPLRSCLLLAFESLICIPYAINLHRKVAALTVQSGRSDVLALAGRLLDPDDQTALRQYIREAIDGQLARLDADQARAKELSEMRARMEHDDGSS